MSADSNKALLSRVYEIVNSGELDRVGEVVAHDFVEHEEFPGLEGGGLEGFLTFARTFRAAFPDLRFTPFDLVAEGDKVAARVLIEGTHRGELAGMPPTGRTIAVSAIDLVRVADGKLVEHWGNTDTLGMMQQLGAIPAAG